MRCAARASPSRTGAGCTATGTTGPPRAKAEEAIERLKEAYGAAGALSVVEPKGGELSVPDDERRRAGAAARRERSREP